MDDAPVLVDIRDGYRVLTLNRPERINAFNLAMHVALRAAIEAATDDSACRAILITGAGRGFCSGQDLNDRLVQPGEFAKKTNTLEEHYNPLIRSLHALPIPVVAAVHGVAAGAGASLALGCDIVLAARSARFIQAFVKIGLIPDAGSTWALPRLVGMARARGLALTGEPIGAEQAADWGLIWKAVDDEALMTEAHALCAGFASAPAVALALTKKALNASLRNDLAAQLELERDLQYQAGATADYAEGVRAFIEKRPPNFARQRK